MNAKLIEGMTFADYRSLVGYNSSKLKQGVKSAAHLKAAIDGLFDKDTAAMRVGRAIHTKLLEPQNYESEFVIAKPCQAPLKSGKRIGEKCSASSSYLNGVTWYCAKHAPEGASYPDNALTEDQAKNVEGMYASVMNHPVAKLLRVIGGCETTITWERDGLPCKARLDKLTHKTETWPHTIVDIKKVKLGGASDREFSWDIENYGYDFSAAWYCEAVRELTGDVPAFIWVVVEEEPPHAVNVIHANASTLQVGMMKTAVAWQRLKHGLETGEWPGYSQDIHYGGLPSSIIKEWLKS